jgi:uncharacterized membrane protein
MKTRLIQLICLFLLMLVTGVFWGTWFTLTRSLANFTAPEFIHIGKVIIANVAVPMSIIMPLCILFLILSCWYYPKKRTAGFYFCISALILIIITLLITLVILVPIDNQIKEWTAATIPADWEALRLKWENFHTMRTFTSLASFACYEISVIINPGSDLLSKNH